MEKHVKVNTEQFLINFKNNYILNLYFIDYTTFLMYSRVDKIDSISITENSNFNTPFRVLESKKFMQNVIALSYDFARSLLFYSDIQRGSIDAVHFNDTGHRVIVDRKYFLFCSIKVLKKIVIFLYFVLIV